MNNRKNVIFISAIILLFFYTLLSGCAKEELLIFPGLLEKKEIYYENGNLNSYTLVYYNKLRQKVCEQKHDKYDNIEYVIKYKYNKAGQISELRQSSPDNKQYFKVVSKYDADSALLISASKYDNKNRLAGVSNFIYDDKGANSRTEEYRQGKLTAVIKNDFDSDGKLLKSEFYDPFGDLQYYTVFIYNAEGRETSQTSYNQKGEAQSSVKSFYENGDIVKLEKYDNQNLIFYTMCIYH